MKCDLEVTIQAIVILSGAWDFTIVLLTLRETMWDKHLLSYRGGFVITLNNKMKHCQCAPFVSTNDGVYAWSEVVERCFLVIGPISRHRNLIIHIIIGGGRIRITEYVSNVTRRVKNVCVDISQYHRTTGYAARIVKLKRRGG